MATELLPDGVWELVEPFLPVAKAKPKGGRPPLGGQGMSHRIAFVLRSGISWEMLPQRDGLRLPAYDQYQASNTNETISIAEVSGMARLDEETAHIGPGSWR